MTALADRAAAIRQHLDRLGCDPATARRYSFAAARFEELRLHQHDGKTTPADDGRIDELERMLKVLTRKLGLGDDVTDANGFLVNDPQRARVMLKRWLPHNYRCCDKYCRREIVLLVLQELSSQRVIAVSFA